MTWPALQTSTIQHKQGDTTYFTHTGSLYEALSEKLFPFFKQTLTPTVRFIREEKGVKTSDTTRRVARIEFSVAASKAKGVNLGSIPALKSGSYATGENATPGKDFGLLAAYMDNQTALKLTNLGHEPDRNRPLVAPLLGYYIVTRFPVVLETAIKRHFKVKPGK